MSHRPAVHPVAILAVAVGLAGLVGCRMGFDSGSDQARSAAEGNTTEPGLHRSLRLPSLPPGDACPQTPGSRPNPDVGVALGSGPAYPVLGFEDGKDVVELGADELRDGSYWHKTLWAIDPRYDGPVLIRAGGVSPPHEVAFGYDDQERQQLEFPAGETDRWRYGPSFTILPGPGCYAYQVDGTSFSEVIVFRAVGATESALEGKPQRGVLELGEGRASARFRVTALEPPAHTYDIRVRTVASADISVRIRTWYGQRLRVLDAVSDDASCRIERGRADCTRQFPALEAQRAGPWDVIVSKRSGPPVTVRVAVTFNAV